MRSIFRPTGLLAGLLLLAGCEPDPDRILSVNAEGAISALVALDRNGDDAVTPTADAPVAGVRIAVLRSQGDTVGTAITDANGLGRVTGLPVGRYRIVLDQAALGDSIRLVRVDSAMVTVAAQDTARATVVVGYPSLTVAQARIAALARKVSVEAVALHASNVFGDSTLHVADSTGALRVVRVSPQIRVVAGDSLRLIGHIDTDLGQPVLAEPFAALLGKGRVPGPVSVNTGQASTARGGSLDAALVQISRAEVIDASLTAVGDVRLRVDDGAGVLEILLDRDARITSEVPLLPGALVTAVGVLTPAATGGSWQLRPRATSDLNLEVPEITIVAARGTTPGRLVAVRGVTLTGPSTFGDGTVHVADATAAIRAVDVRSSFVTLGDSVKFLARVEVRGGQPVLVAPITTVLGKGTIPAPVQVTAAEATTARSGRLDAALVQVRGVQVDSVFASGQDLALRVRDDSGELRVVLDESTDILASESLAGANLDVTGVLVFVPSASNSVWVLKPRSRADVVRR